MTTAVTPQASSFDQVIRLKLSRAAYDTLADSLGDNGHVRLTYDGEILEIVSPSSLHEIISRAVAGLLYSVTLEWELDITDLGSTRFKPGGGAEFEADGAWYLDMKTKVRDRRNIDLAIDSPPDILLETDISTNSSDKLEIFAAMRVPEVWLYNLGGFTAKALENGKYEPIAISRVIVGLPIAEIAKRLEDEANGSQLDSLTLQRNWQQWLHKHKHLDGGTN